MLARNFRSHALAWNSDWLVALFTFDVIGRINLVLGEKKNQLFRHRSESARINDYPLDILVLGSISEGKINTDNPLLYLPQLQANLK